MSLGMLGDIMRDVLLYNGFIYQAANFPELPELNLDLGNLC